MPSLTDGGADARAQVFSGVGVAIMGLPPAHQWTLSGEIWRYVAALVLLGLMLWALRSCWTSEACTGVGSLIMMMPGASVGAVLVILVLVCTVVLPFITDMFDHLTPQTNPTAFFMLLPTLAFAVRRRPNLAAAASPLPLPGAPAHRQPPHRSPSRAPQVLFWGMALHWVWLLCEGISQKAFLKLKGWGRKKKPAGENAAADVEKGSAGASGGGGGAQAEEGIKTGFLKGKGKGGLALV